MNNLSRLVWMGSRRCKQLILLSLALNGVSAFATVLWPAVLGRLVDEVLRRRTPVAISLVIFVIVSMFAVRAVARAGGAYGQRWVVDRLAADLRITLYTQLHRLD